MSVQTTRLVEQVDVATDALGYAEAVFDAIEHGDLLLYPERMTTAALLINLAAAKVKAAYAEVLRASGAEGCQS